MDSIVEVLDRGYWHRRVRLAVGWVGAVTDVLGASQFVVDDIIEGLPLLVF